MLSFDPVLASTSVLGLVAFLGLGRLAGPSFLGSGLLLYVVACFSLMKVAEKSSAKSESMLAWIPILNVLLMLKIADRPMWWVLLFLVPVLNVVMWVVLCVALARARDRGLLLGLLMAFVPIIGFPVLALSE